jgi:hypothetical protein
LYRGIFNLHRGRLDIDRGIGVLEQGRFHLKRGRLDVDQDIGDLHQGILDLDSPNAGAVAFESPAARASRT